MVQEVLQLGEMLCMAKTSQEIKNISREIKIISETVDVSIPILDLMEKSFFEENWRCLSRLIFVAQQHPNNRYVPLICKLLDNYRNDSYMEAIADLIIDITINVKDERCVQPLINALNYKVVGDISCHFNRKILYALANIETNEATKGIKLALQHPHDLVRELARKLLRNLKQQ